MLILPASTYNTSEFMTAAGKLDVDVVVASDRGQVLQSQFPAGMLQLEFDEPDRAVEQISEYNRQWPLHSIIGVDDHAAWLAAMACQALAIPHNSPEAVRAAGNKLLMRQQLESAGLPAPAFEVVDVDGDAGEIAARVVYPCVLKPLFLAASRGVIRADDVEHFIVAFERIGKLLSQPRIARRGGEAATQILIEGYVPGAEVALEGLLVAGRLRVLALFDKPDPLEGPYFAETIYVTPSRLDPEMQSRVAKQVEEAAAALGLNEGPVHAELRLTDVGVSDGVSAGIYVIEIAARSIGGLCSRVLEFGAGISLEELILRHALGQPADSLERTDIAGGVMMLPVPARGRLRGVDGLDAASMVPGIKEVLITIPIGKDVHPLPEGDRYLGFMFAEGDTPAGVEAALRQAYAKLDIIIDGKAPS
jgi:biotin carboxylase